MTIQELKDMAIKSIKQYFRPITWFYEQGKRICGQKMMKKC